MSPRTNRSTTHFRAPFALRGMDGLQPAGEYEISVDEEPIDGLSFLAWRRVATFIHLPAIGARSMGGQMLPVDPEELQAAIDRDATALDKG